jgi:hypothetical protein
MILKYTSEALLEHIIDRYYLYLSAYPGVYGVYWNSSQMLVQRKVAANRLDSQHRSL